MRIKRTSQIDGAWVNHDTGSGLYEEESDTAVGFKPGNKKNKKKKKKRVYQLGVDVPGLEDTSDDHRKTKGRSKRE